MIDTDREKQEQTRDPEDEISQEELEAERAGALPDREALSVLGADVAIPADPSIAADVLSGEDPPEDLPEEP
jgi:hypothetical protein